MIIVFGSVNMNMIVGLDRPPEKGETILGDSYEMSPGGKGGNQALAAARTGAKVTLVGRIGDDGTGLRLLNGLRRDGVSTSGVAQSPQPTGMSVIMREQNGDNRVISIPGANSDATNDQVPDEILKPGNMILAQGETNPAETLTLLKRAHEAGAKTVFNMAPVRQCDKVIFKYIDYLILNEIEAEQLASILEIKADDSIALAQKIAATHDLTCVITMAEKGSVAVTPHKKLIYCKSMPLETIIDTTGAGDAYCGTLAALIHAGEPLTKAMHAAATAGALTCTKAGTQDAIPYWGDIQETIENIEFPVEKTL